MIEDAQTADNFLPEKQDGEIRIAHLSDLHFYSQRWKIGGKVRRLVYRSRPECLDIIDTVLRDLLSSEIDHVVITGDITASAKAQEFEDAKRMLAPIDNPSFLSVVPGNHDVSAGTNGDEMFDERCPRKLRRFWQHFGHLVPDEYPPEYGIEKRLPFPFIKNIGSEICVIGIDTTTRLSAKLLALNALGNVGEKQFDELSKLFATDAMAPRIKIAIMHHHPMIMPFYKWGDSLTDLRKARRLLDLLYCGKVDIILHGHKHNPFCWQSHAFRKHNLAVICAAPPNTLETDANRIEQPLVYNVYSFLDGQIKIHYKECTYRAKAREATFSYTA